MIGVGVAIGSGEVIFTLLTQPNIKQKKTHKITVVNFI
jgi:hypothetical protein